MISQRLELEIESHPFEIYRTLRVVNPSPFMFYLRTPRVTLVGSSPEIMVRVVDGRITVRPLAGTRRRGANDEEDRRLAEELLADPKERAEHVMLVDLGRNDVGRVARYRSVEVTDVMTIERYSHVMHITSNVSGQLAEGRDAFDALRACLPAGTVSGAPRSGPWRSSTKSNPTAAGPMPEPSAISTSAATWTPASPCERSSCKAIGPTSKPAPASWPTATRPANIKKRSTKPAACSRPSKSPSGGRGRIAGRRPGRRPPGRPSAAAGGPAACAAHRALVWRAIGIARAAAGKRAAAVGLFLAGDFGLGTGLLASVILLSHGHCIDSQQSAP